MEKPFLIERRDSQNNSTLRLEYICACCSGYEADGGGKTRYLMRPTLLSQDAEAPMVRVVKLGSFGSSGTPISRNPKQEDMCGNMCGPCLQQPRLR